MAVISVFAGGDRLSRRFLPISGDRKVGGHFKFEGNAGGDIQSCETPDHIAVIRGVMGKVSWVDLTFAAEGAGPRVTRRRTAKASDMPPRHVGPVRPRCGRQRLGGRLSGAGPLSVLVAPGDGPIGGRSGPRGRLGYCAAFIWKPSSILSDGTTG